MDIGKIINDLWASPVFNAIFFGVLGNFAYQILRRPVNRFFASIPTTTRGILSTISAKAKARIEADDKRRLFRIAYLINNPTKFAEFKQAVIYKKISGLLVILIGLSFEVFGLSFYTALQGISISYLVMGAPSRAKTDETALWIIYGALAVGLIVGVIGGIRLTQGLYQDPLIKVTNYNVKSHDEYLAKDRNIEHWD